MSNAIIGIIGFGFPVGPWEIVAILAVALLLFGIGFCAISAYVLMITLSRYATGLSLGQRMGFMVGGTWALANIVFMALLPAAEHFGPNVILKFVPLGYLCSGAFGLFIMYKAKNSTRAKLSAQ